LGWIPTEPGSPDLVPDGAGTVHLQVNVSRTGRYEVYLQGTARNRLSLDIDGEQVATVQEQPDASQQFLYFGEAQLAAGPHDVSLVMDRHWKRRQPRTDRAARADPG
jgi:hypothetical protein